ncbi:MAG: ribulose-phosphate 3-epimerase [Pseudomonadota bacterium]
MTTPHPLIAPSILAADYSKLADEVRNVATAGADWIHLDIMDGHFVPNISFGPDLIAALRPVCGLPFDVHLMIEPYEPYLEAFANAGADHISVHVEAGPHLHRALSAIRGMNKKAGVAINPATPIEAVSPVIDCVDLIIIMTVNPGFGGQKFIHSQLEKIRQARTLIGDRDIIIEVDGGVTAETAPLAIEAGATALVAGSAVFGQSSNSENPYGAAISALRSPAR